MGLSLGLRGPDLGPQHRLGGWGQVKVRQEIDGAQAEQLKSVLYRGYTHSKSKEELNPA